MVTGEGDASSSRIRRTEGTVRWDRRIASASTPQTEPSDSSSVRKARILSAMPQPSWFGKASEAFLVDSSSRGKRSGFHERPTVRWTLAAREAAPTGRCPGAKPPITWGFPGRHPLNRSACGEPVRVHRAWGVRRRCSATAGPGGLQERCATWPLRLAAHEPDVRAALGRVHVLDDLESEALVERNVARRARLED